MPPAAAAARRAPGLGHGYVHRWLYAAVHGGGGRGGRGVGSCRTMLGDFKAAGLGFLDHLFALMAPFPTVCHVLKHVALLACQPHALWVPPPPPTKCTPPPSVQALAAGSRLPCRLAEVLLEHQLGHPVAVQQMMAARRGLTRSLTGPLDGSSVESARNAFASSGGGSGGGGGSMRRPPASPSMDEAQFGRATQQQQQAAAAAEQHRLQLLQQDRFLDLLDTADDSRCSDQEDYGLLLSVASMSSMMAGAMASRGSIVLAAPGTPEQGGNEADAAPLAVQLPEAWIETLASVTSPQVASPPLAPGSSSPPVRGAPSVLLGRQASPTRAGGSGQAGPVSASRPPWVPPQSPPLDIRARTAAPVVSLEPPQLSNAMPQEAAPPPAATLPSTLQCERDGEPGIGVTGDVSNTRQQQGQHQLPLSPLHVSTSGPIATTFTALWRRAVAGVVRQHDLHLRPLVDRLGPGPGTAFAQQLGWRPVAFVLLVAFLMACLVPFRR